eukprot:CAMPEP_0176388848 /NCGR_PEP_ID=MMETSP0126-20121128/37907_1 /TAXON_ID=141414 ORGANISM="Strombidinopsis acuminatum, Strain SPMC142" /NCGR_SAMPLE_ID=MMETSP0126 /ASSEMBLY_ACC=CAM_ASM_000229 /LENGTH=47 /DNA_ID= /DNA_START= /DNA_END= /DNA_ORIENTATION=
MKQGFDLSIERLDEGLIYSNANVNLLIYEDQISEKNRKKTVEAKKYN